MWWLCVLYSYLDASTEEYAEEEEVYTQGEEDHFDQYNTQGKLIPLQSAKLSKSKAPHLVISCLLSLSQFYYKFCFQVLLLYFIKVLLIHDSPGLE